MKKELRNYQKEALECIIQSFKENNRQIVVLPTGSGKTVLFANLLDKLNLKTLIIAHTQELLHQIQNTIYKE